MFKYLRQWNRNRKRQRRFVAHRYPQYKIGPHTYGPVEICSWSRSDTLEIGDYCSFAEGSKILLGGEHRTDWVTTYPFNVFWPAARHMGSQARSKGAVIIGNDVWVGTDALILSGVTIGDGAVIGARAVVTKDVPPYAVVAGNPARVIRMRFDEATIARLLKIRWWEWDNARIEKFLPLMMSGNIENFFTATETNPTKF